MLARLDLLMLALSLWIDKLKVLWPNLHPIRTQRPRSRPPPSAPLLVSGLR